jgi:peptide/nickel transport system substrate-binding protein
MSARRYKEMAYGYNSGIGTYFKMINYNGSSQFNGSYVDDARVKEVYAQMMDWVGIDEDKMIQAHREIIPYVLEQAWVISFPNPYGYIFWQPWLKNYDGESYIGYYNTSLNTKYVWLDLDLKEEMTGRR